MVTPKVQDYLKSIHRLQSDDVPAQSSQIAAEMGVQPPTVTTMLQRLSEDGLVEYERYRGARLTPDGERQALAVLRNHRLLERFLTEYLGYDWSNVHDEADVLEHYISEKFADRIAELLGYPVTDPHGAPIPTRDLEIPRGSPQYSVDQCREGDVVVVSEVRNSSSDVLTYLSNAGVTLGATLEIVEVAPFGMITVEVRGTGDQLSLPTDTAVNIYVARPGESAVAAEQLSEMS
ncbi:metal-dependent transcriptional regulator [Haloferax sp. DFSO60]|uniref:metal-dependent transcriptional regulator n=1 Tax=Haloferax sp. DFSO60 TaxID=3388652 RepID=UPI00397D7826